MSLTFTEFIQTEYADKPHYLVIGHPISHSLSPLMHSIAIKHYSLDATYVAVDIYPEDISAFVAWLNKSEFKGCNITIPYKQKFFQIVDDVEQNAANIGAINTIVKENSKIVGYNTDVHGFVKPIQKEMVELEGTNAIIFGTGGASKAIVQGLFSLGVDQVFLVSRTPEKRHLASDSVQFLSYNEWQARIDSASILINTTPLGMYPKTGLSPVRDSETDLLKGKICYDIVYNPLKTKFLKQAEQNATLTINGLDMLIYQGSKSFELWTGYSFPYEKVKTYLMSKLTT